MRILKRRILPATCPSTTCSLSSFTRNIAFGRASITSPSNSTLSSFATPYPIWRQHLSAWRPLVSCIELKLPARGRRRRFAPGTGVLVFTVYAERKGAQLDRQALLKLVNLDNQ